eukprot:1050655-Alexandrium_andersonii.AAC.1
MSSTTCVHVRTHPYVVAKARTHPWDQNAMNWALRIQLAIRQNTLQAELQELLSYRERGLYNASAQIFCA